jgi:hypothetical protein
VCAGNVGNANILPTQPLPLASSAQLFPSMVVVPDIVGPACRINGFRASFLFIKPCLSAIDMLIRKACGQNLKPHNNNFNQ